MAYQAGVATSPTNLLQSLVTFLVANGWTQDMSQADGAGWRAHLHKGTNFVHLRAAVNETIWAAQSQVGYGIGVYLSTAFSSSAAWNQQPGTPPYQNGSSTLVVGCAMSLPSGAVQNHYFFSDASNDNIVVVAEKTAGLFTHIGWGLSLSKCGTWSEGAYFFGSTSGYDLNNSSPGPGLTLTSSCPGCFGDYQNTQNCFVRVDVDTFTGKWCGAGTAIAGNTGYTGKNLVSAVYANGAGNVAQDGNIPMYTTNTSTATPTDFQYCQTSAIDGRANLLPVHLYAIRDAGQRSLLGAVPNIFSTNGVGNGFSPAAEYVIGTTTYKMFPNYAVVKQ